MRDLRGSTEAVRGEEVLKGMTTDDRKAVIFAIMSYIGLFTDATISGSAGNVDFGRRLVELGLEPKENEELFQPLYELLTAGEERGVGMLRRSVEGKLVSAGILTPDKAEKMSIYDLINFLLEKATGVDYSLT